MSEETTEYAALEARVSAGRALAAWLPHEAQRGPKIVFLSQQEAEVLAEYIQALEREAGPQPEIAALVQGLTRPSDRVTIAYYGIWHVEIAGVLDTSAKTLPAALRRLQRCLEEREAREYREREG